jgi:hypothetical protein
MAAGNPDTSNERTTPTIFPANTNQENAITQTVSSAVTEAPTLTSQPPQESALVTPVPNGLPGEAGLRFPGRVVMVTHPEAHTWNYQDLEYWDAVNQTAVDAMVDAGIMQLTGQSSLADAWRALIPNYQAGEVVAIKVSFNNSHDEAGSIQEIDGIIEPVNAIIRGLHSLSVPNSSIVVYDSSRYLPKRFMDGCDYPGIQFRYAIHDPWGEGAADVQFFPPGASAFTERLSREVTQASYLINIPILKWHGMTHFSMAMKNHYGSVEKPDQLHQWSSLGSPDYSAKYNPMVDLNNTPHIREKTVLTVGDAIFAAFKNFDTASFPRPWKTFGNQTPKTLYFSTDPVSIDCVMADTLSIEKAALGSGEINPVAYEFLSLAESIGLGVYDRGNPLKNSYTKIKLMKLDL